MQPFLNILIKSSMPGKIRTAKYPEAVCAIDSRWVMQVGTPRFMETTGMLPAKMVVEGKGSDSVLTSRKINNKRDTNKEELANFIVER